MFDLTTKYSDKTAETPFIQKALQTSGATLSFSRPLKPSHSGSLQAKDPEGLPTRSGPTAKPERSANGGSVKARQPTPSRYARRIDRDRLARFHEAVVFAYAMDWPLNTGLTITWTALQTAGERNEGHTLGRGERDREKYIRDELARLCRSDGLPFVALWGRDVGAYMGPHTHLSMFWPSRKLGQLVAVIERISGSSADFVLTPYAENVAARSVCGGWQINMSRRKDDKASALEWAGYIANQHTKHPAPPKITGKAFGISEAIGKAAQERAKPMLEARKASYR